MKPLPFLLATLMAVTVLAEDVTPGGSIFGQRQFIEYVKGDLPLVIAVPHGGRLQPGDIPDRATGVRDIDANTQELARTIAEVIHEGTRGQAHLVICHLHRSKLDVNRELAEAAQGNALVEQAWREHHEFIEQACATAVKQHGVAFLIDLHGHGHADPRVELGYLHNALALADCDEALNEATYVHASSLRWIVEHSPLSHVELLRGPRSFGAMLEANGFPATPSPRMPVPTEPFFRGGYTVQRHCVASRNITGLQIEANRPRLRDTAENRLKFARALLPTLQTYFTAHLGFGIDGRKPAATVGPMANSQPEGTVPVPAQ
ncbi:MAG: N-formylglutamate amidohydrolase [Prosthecobacter sp.]|jgi:hypothetical protein|uniref:hypothetical protein n=1 Tax=Prosthecobacter sp. TaxID=1965333 RepID=UPI0019F8D772|nr:hypothetical protein [Prosthecobacter sp.]MBE2287758.1 N-formylglutamate amidohydrolase [Prosthecobacter sp.]